VTAEASPTSTPVDLSGVKSAKDTAEAYAEVWSNGNYDQLYDLLTSAAQAKITRDDFVARYDGIAVEAGIITVDAKIVGGNDDDEMFPMKVTIESSRVGEIKDDNLLPLVKDGDRYGVDWSPNLIFSQLGDGYVRWESDVPQRGRILDRKGRPLAEMGKLTRVGVVPGKVENQDDMLQKLSQILSMPVDTIKARIEGGQADWFMPVKDMPDNVDQAVLDQLGAIPGVAVQKAPARVYPAGPVTAHVVGYMSQITADELPELAKQGYESGDLIGRTGVEAWGEQWLAGKRGGNLKLIRQDGTTIRVLGEVAAQPSHDIVLTLDLDIQQAAYDALGDEAGADVVLDPNNGEVLAMVSKPSFDPNWFILGITDDQWAQLNDANKTPLVNRATAFATSTGSIFKVITAAAGMKDLGYTEDTVIPCPGEFMLDGSQQVWHDWIPGGQGDLTLHNGIVRSCNTVFYRIGAELDKKGENLLPDMAKAFGLGKLTGLPELYEIPGIVPDPEWKMENVGDFWARGDAVNLAIGQGYLTATPLQMANVYAALANGGTLYQPHLTLDIVNLDGTIAQKGEVKEIGKLPISGEQIAAIQSALYDVINASNGTAVEPFVGINHDVSGKTGTEQTGEQGEGTNAWFAAYTPSNAPKMTTIVFVAKGVAGSKSAAPVARKIIDKWYEVYPEQ
jgi:penicillin-binding protein 2